MKVTKFALPLRISSALKDGGVTLRALYFLLYGSSGACFPFFNVYLRQIGLSGLQIGAIASIRPAATLISQPLWGVGADLWGRRRTLLVTIMK